MKTKTGQTQSVSFFQSIAEGLAKKLPEKTKPFFLSLMPGAWRRTVTTWLQAAQISDDFRQAFYTCPTSDARAL